MASPAKFTSALRGALVLVWATYVVCGVGIAYIYRCDAVSGIKGEGGLTSEWKQTGATARPVGSPKSTSEWKQALAHGQARCHPKINI